MESQDQTSLFFDQLTNDRRELVQALHKARFIDFIVSHIVDTYSGSAHFIYELLQNADDARATKARLTLKDDRLIFAHNGTVHFTVTDPATEDLPGVKAGHINAITNFSRTTKRPEDIVNQIGKFGIGFKSVFQYTLAPEVYNPPFCFKIEQYMIPKRIELNQALFEKDETTIFVIPFDNPDKPAAAAFEEIKVKLQEINNPLLFLNHLKNFSWVCGFEGSNFKKVVRKDKAAVNFPDTDVMDCQLEQQKILRIDRLLQIQQQNGKSLQTKISIGFVLDKKGNISNDTTVSEWYADAYCFFPTKEKTGLSYLLHAPFILTPNREGIKEGRIENIQLINHLGDLLADALAVLKAKKILNPTFFNSLKFPTETAKAFVPISAKQIARLRSGQFIPMPGGDYVPAANAFACTQPELITLLEFDNYIALRSLVKNDEAVLVFPERRVFTQPGVFDQIVKEIIQVNIDINWFIARVTPQLLSTMSKDWLSLFFDFLSDNEYFTRKNAPLLKVAFIPLEKIEGAEEEEDEFDFAAPYDKNGNVQVYLQGKPGVNHKVVASFLLDSEKTVLLLKRLELRIPDEFDEIIREVIPPYRQAEHTRSAENAAQTMKRLLNFLKDCKPSQKEQLIKELQDASWVIGKNNQGESKFHLPARKPVYYPLPELRSYFGEESKVFWLDSEVYQPVFKKWNEADLLPILSSLQIKLRPSLLFLKHTQITNELLERFNLTDQRSTGPKTLTDFFLDGLEEALLRIDYTTSRLIAGAVIESAIGRWRAHFDWSYYGPQSTNTDSTYIRLLKEQAWVYDSNLACHRPADINTDNLHPDYPPEFLSKLLELGAVLNDTEERLSGLNQEERSALKIIQEAIDGGLSQEELAALVQTGLANKNRPKPADGTTDTAPDETDPEELGKKWVEKAVDDVNSRKKDQKSKGKTPAGEIPKPYVTPDDPSEEDEDEELAPNPIDPAQRKSKLEDNKIKELSAAIELEAKRAETEEIVRSSEMYSFGWFKALLELEDSFATEDRVKKNPIRVVFNKAELDQDGILILSETTYVPLTIEDMGQLQIMLYTDQVQKTVLAEVVSPQKNRLKVKLTKADQLDGFDLSAVHRAVVEVSSADFILEKLKNAFRALPFLDGDNLHDRLPEDLKFIFGPPGTGKTTFLSWLIGGKQPGDLTLAGEQVMPIMELEAQKVLVLTPTNKAADVLVEKIIGNYKEDGDSSYLDWLIRFGETKSESLMHSPVFVNNKKLESWVYGSCALVTTIARYPYDGFEIERAGKDMDKFRLRDFKWDYIIFDEASMISLASILYVIYYAVKLNPDVTFIIGGDPFQIHPIIKYEWPGWSYLPEPALLPDGSPKLDDQGQPMVYKIDGGNIYSMIGLIRDDSFVNPQTTPHPYPVHHLKKQFRSVPALGELFSKYRYSGELKHDRTPEEIGLKPAKAAKDIQIRNFPIKPLTIVHYQVRKYDSIYRSRSIKGSPYHIYSAIFTIEILQYIQKNAQVKTGEKYRIGVICPYKIQENIINKMVESTVKGTIEVITGTVHGFQGDECDMIIAVMSPPVNISRSTRTFLNKKNILNVAISRARDNLILLLPADDEGLVNTKDLHQIEALKRIAKQVPEIKANLLEYQAEELEAALLLDRHAIENFSFPTAHQQVNIYAVPKNKYEIRFDENAVDLQIRPNDG